MVLKVGLVLSSVCGVGCVGAGFELLGLDLGIWFAGLMYIGLVAYCFGGLRGLFGWAVHFGLSLGCCICGMVCML